MKTIVTELRTYLIDAITRSTMFRQSFSTKVQNDLFETLAQTLEPGTIKTINNVSKLLQLRVDFPVELTITQTGPVQVDPEEPPTPIYNTATLSASDFVAGQLIIIEVRDTDIPIAVPEVRVVIFNTRTGETEQLMLQRNADHVYTGQQLTTFNGVSNDFDGVLNCEHQDVIHILYQDARDVTGNLITITKPIVANSPYTDTELEVNSYLHVSKPVAILMIDPDIDTPTHPCVVRNVTTGEEENILLSRTSANTYTHSLPTTLNNGTVVNNDGVLQVSVGDQITVSVMDSNNVVPTTIRNVEVRDSVYTNGIIVLPPSIVPNSSVSLSFFDYDRAGVSHIDIAVSNTRTGEFEYVRVYERVTGSGSFAGQLSVSNDIQNSVSGDGVLGVIVGDTIRAVYIDVTSPDASSTVISREAIVVASTPVLPPEPDEPDEPDVPDEPEFESQSIVMVCDGAFVFGGKFNGSITVRALQRPVRLELLFV